MKGLFETGPALRGREGHEADAAPIEQPRIDVEDLLPSGGEEEVEIRAVAVTAAERLAAACARRGFALPVHRLDALLWTRGQHPRIKARPRHRTRCTGY